MATESGWKPFASERTVFLAAATKKNAADDLACGFWFNDLSSAASFAQPRRLRVYEAVVSVRIVGAHSGFTRPDDVHLEGT